MENVKYGCLISFLLSIVRYTCMIDLQGSAYCVPLCVLWVLMFWFILPRFDGTNAELSTTEYIYQWLILFMECAITSNLVSKDEFDPFKEWVNVIAAVL